MTADGSKGKLGMVAHPLASITQEGGQLVVRRMEETKFAKSIHGMTRSRAQAVIDGVDRGFNKKLELVGTGYRVIKQGQGLSLSLGFSHPVIVDPVEGISFEIE